MIDRYHKRKMADWCREYMTVAEGILWHELKARRFGPGNRFKAQVPFAGYILDFACRRHKVAIEVDGGYHFTREQRERDAVREKKITDCGWRVLRFTNKDIAERRAWVLEQIAAAIGAIAPQPKRWSAKQVAKVRQQAAMRRTSQPPLAPKRPPEPVRTAVGLIKRAE